MDNLSQSPEPNVYWFTFRLRTVMLFIVLFFVAVQGLLVSFDSYCDCVESWGTDHLRRLGASVHLGTKDHSVVKADIRSLPAEAWNDLRHLSEYHSLSFDLSGSVVSDADLQQLAAIPRLDEAILTRTPVTYDGVRKLQQALPDCRIEWEPLRPRSFDAVERAPAQANAAAIEDLGGTVGVDETDPNKPVISVDLGRASVNDARLRCLRGHAKLTWLDLSGAAVRGTGLKHIEDLNHLVWLNLRGSEVTDAGLQHLEGLTELRYLDLTDTHVTDAGLAQLRGLTSLGTLRLDGTKFTYQAAQDLHRALPGCTIWHRGSGPECSRYTVCAILFCMPFVAVLISRRCFENRWLVGASTVALTTNGWSMLSLIPLLYLWPGSHVGATELLMPGFCGLVSLLIGIPLSLIGCLGSRGIYRLWSALAILLNLAVFPLSVLLTKMIATAVGLTYCR